MADLVSVKRGLINLIKILESPSYIAKFMDGFFELPVSVQYSLVEWISVEADQRKWRELAGDETLLPKAIRSIIFYYSGREDLKQPSKDDLKKLVADYIRKRAESDLVEHEKIGDTVDIKDFTEELEDL